MTDVTKATVNFSDAQSMTGITIHRYRYLNFLDYLYGVFDDRGRILSTHRTLRAAKAAAMALQIAR